MYCNTVTVAATRRAGAGLGVQALGRRSGGRRGQVWALRRARGADGQALGVQGRAERKACGRQARGQALGASASARGERSGRWARGLAKAVHSVHSAWFSTRFFRLGIFPESLNEHCSL